MICVSFGNITLQEALKISKDLEIIEIRADLLKWPIEEYEKLISSGIKSVMTCRPGYYNNAERLKLFESAARSGAAFIDIELESDDSFRQNVLDIIQPYSTELIISYHNYETTPEKTELESILDECYSKSAQIAKIACRVYTFADTARILSLYEKPGRKIIIGMGNMGKISRLAAGLLGAEFTYASVSKESGTAEGQIDYKTMNKIYTLLKNGL